MKGLLLMNHKIKPEALAYELGYRAINGRVWSPRTNQFLKGNLKKGASNGYWRFKLSTGSKKTNNRKDYTIDVHRFVAYQKYKEGIFKEGLVVRHLNNDSICNEAWNLVLGTQSQNMMDRPPEQRLAHAIHASCSIRKFTDAEMNAIRIYHNAHRSYKKTMQKFGISSKGTLNRILRTNYATKVKSINREKHERIAA